MQPRGVERYGVLVTIGPRLQVTGHVIKPCRFAVLRDDEVHGWLGASPDGLIDSLSAQPGLTPDPQALVASLSALSMICWPQVIPDCL